MEKLNELINFLYKKNLLSLLIVIVVTFIVIMGGINYIKPVCDSILDIKKQNQTNAEKLSKLKDQLKAEQNKIKAEKGKINKVPVSVYKPLNPNMPLESSSIDLVTNIIKTLEKTHNTIIDISYKTESSQSSGIPANISVVQLNMTINGTYTSFQDFVFELYDDAYIATIKAIRMIPLQENKSTLEITTEIWLYLAK